MNLFIPSGNPASAGFFFVVFTSVGGTITGDAKPGKMPTPTPISADAARRGVFAAMGAYIIWGLVPIYFKALAHVGAGEIVAQRVLWSLFLMAGILLLRRDLAGIAALRAEPRRILGLVLSTLCITGNWLVFVWAVNAGRVLETSLGYYINPLVTMLLAMLFLGERLRPVQWVALGLAAAGVANQLWQLGALPWVSLVLAATFACYTLLRKLIAIDAFNGLFFETLFAAPLAAIYLLSVGQGGELAFGRFGTGTDLLLVAAGVVTAVPLVLFAYGARRVSLATMGFLQYIAPSLTFLQAVLIYDEPFGSAQLLTFALIWAGLVLYSADAWRRSRRVDEPA
jgi:chloramphenicol-sensitive protein RarD